VDHLLDISDVDGKAFRISIELPLNYRTTNQRNSSWRVLDEGILKFRSGGCLFKGITTDDIFLFVGDEAGLSIFRLFEDNALVTTGSGEVRQSWCVQLKPGRITWVLLK
jgi:hypothetical protein